MTIAQQIGRVNAGLEQTARAKDFVELCRALLLSRGDLEAASRTELPKQAQLVLKDAMTTGLILADTAPFLPLSVAFTATLSNVGVFDAVLADAVQVPLLARVSAITVDASASVVGEGASKPITDITFAGVTLERKKAAAVVVLTEELLRAGAAGSLALLENSLRTGVARATDEIFLAAMIALTTPVASSGNLFEDLRTATAAAGSGATSRFHLIVGPGVARNLALTSTVDGAMVFPQLTPQGGVLAGITVHASDALTDDALLIDASALAAHADPVTIRISREASLSLSSASPSAAADFSLFQTNAAGIMCERTFGFQLLRAAAAQSISGVEWGLVGSPPA